MKERKWTRELLEFIFGVMEEAKEENLRQVQQLCEKLIERFRHYALFDEALEVISHLELFMRTNRSSENLGLVFCLRKRAAVHLQSPNVSHHHNMPLLQHVLHFSGL